MKKAYQISLGFAAGNPVQGEILRCILEQLGVAESDIVEQQENARVTVSFFTASKSRALFLKRRIRRLRLKGVSLSLIYLKTKDWQTRWKEDFKPFNLARNVRVVPAGMRDSEKGGNRKRLFIDTDTVFGTGMHPTTRFMAGFIECRQGSFSDFLDIGTGTGILALVAWVCGARRVGGLDISREAIKTAKRNFKGNACFPEFVQAVDLKKFRPERKFDFVAANLLSDELVRLRGKIIACVNPGKYLAVSGISTGNYKRFRLKFDTADLRCLRAIKKEGWAAVLYKVRGKR